MENGNKAERIQKKMQGISKINRSNGREYTVRDNRDRFFYPEEWIGFYSYLKQNQKRTFDIMISTGARINEVRHLKEEDVDYTNKRLILRKTKVKAVKKEKKPRPRTIPFSTQFSRRLKKYFVNKKEYVGVLSTSAANTSMKKALQKAKIKDWYMFSTHNIRKTFEIWLMALGVNDLKIISHVGHSMSVAASNYISPDVFSSKEKMQIREILGDLYQNRY